MLGSAALITSTSSSRREVKVTLSWLRMRLVALAPAVKRRHASSPAMTTRASSASTTATGTERLCSLPLQSGPLLQEDVSVTVNSSGCRLGGISEEGRFVGEDTCGFIEVGG